MTTRCTRCTCRTSKAVIEAGADSVMSSYNSVNGAFLDVNKVLLTDILRDEWGFSGFVSSDWVFGTHDGVRSLEAGMDLEMPLRLLRARTLPTALESGRLSRETVLTSARRILATTLRHYAIRDEGRPPASVVVKAEHRVLARHVAARGAVLLKNEPVDGAAVLPMFPTIRRLTVIGALATEANLGDPGSSRVLPPVTSSPLDGLREALPHTEIVHVDGSDPAAAAQAARDADAAIVVAGLNWNDEGEFIANTNPDSLNALGFPFNSRVLQVTGGKLGSLGKRFAKGGTTSRFRRRPGVRNQRRRRRRAAVGRLPAGRAARWRREHRRHRPRSDPHDATRSRDPHLVAAPGGVGNRRLALQPKHIDRHERTPATTLRAPGRARARRLGRPV
jgi:beta-glucosidase